MGKAALLAVGAFVVMSAVYGVSTSNQLLATQAGMASYNYQEMLRNAAITGFNVSKQRLADNFKATTISGTESDITYSAVATVNNTTKVASITSTAQMEGPDGETLQYAIYAKVQLNSKMPQTVPSYQKYLLITEKDLTLNGNVLLDTLQLKGTTTAKYNADIHTNGQLTLKGNAAEIYGFGTYKTSQDVQHPSRFMPYFNDAKEPVVKHVPQGIPLPLGKMHPDSLKKNSAFDKTTVGDLALPAGTYDHAALGATRENPYVWYVDGNLTLPNADVKIKGYTIFVVSGNISLNGNATVLNQQNAENNLAFIALDRKSTTGVKEGNITMHGNSEYWGQYFAQGDVTFGGTCKIVGNIVAAGKANVSGTPDLFYVPASPGLAQIFEGPDTRLKLLSYSERDLTRVLRSQN